MPQEKRRSKYDLYAEMIEVMARKGQSSLTRISYGANLSVGTAKKSLQLLVSHGFVEEMEAGDSKKFKATRWGLGFLETYKKMRKFFAALEQPVRVSPPKAVLPDRVTTGSEDLDKILLGGIPKNYAVILTAPSCDERQMLLRGFLDAGLKSNQVTFDVTSDASTVRNLAEEFPSSFYLFVCNPHADEMVKTRPNVFKLKGVGNLNEINIALTLAFRALKTGAKSPRRACIEIVSDVLLQHHALDTRRWLSGLLPDLKSRGFTTLAVMNPFMHSSEEVQAIVDLFEGEVSIYENETEDGLGKFLKAKKLYNQRYSDQVQPLGSEALKE